MKILMLNYEFPPIGGGGGKTHLCLLREFSGREDLTIDVLTSAPQPGFSVEVFADNIRIYKVGLHKRDLHHWRRIEVLQWLFKAGRRYRELIGREDYDLVHAFFGFPTGWLCRRRRGSLPYIISLRGSDVPGVHARLALDYKILAPVFKRIWGGASALIACSEGLKRRALKFMPGAKIDVITNAVDGGLFYPREVENHGGKLRLITVGRLSVTKRVEILVEAVELLAREGREVSLKVVGGGAMVDKLRQLVARKRLEQCVEITGRVDYEKMPSIYHQADVFVSASATEGMSNAMLEAMASGLPIVTTRCEGVEELIGENGIVVEEAKAEQIAAAIKSVAEDEGRYEKMSAAAVKRARQFTWAKTTEKYIEYYRKVCKER
jgi:glycosyltransferase involved in cell wall biosynthesis